MRGREKEEENGVRHGMAWFSFGFGRCMAAQRTRDTRAWDLHKCGASGFDFCFIGVTGMTAKQGIGLL
jgi:hypothetical protein